MAKNDGLDIGRNVTATIEGNMLVLRIDPAADGTLSASGKNSVISTTSGNVGLALPGLPAGLKIGLNVYKPR